MGAPIHLPWSDNFLISIFLNSPTQPTAKESITRKGRPWSKLSVESWTAALKNSKPNLDPSPTLASEKLTYWIESSLDRVIPVKTSHSRVRENISPLYSPKLRSLKQVCKQMARKWRKDYYEFSKLKYKESKKIYQSEIKIAQALYYEEKINSAINMPREIFCIAKNLLEPPSSNTSTVVSSDHCNELAEYFHGKIQDMYNVFPGSPCPSDLSAMNRPPDHIMHTL